MQSVNELCEKGNSLSEVGMYQEALSCFKHALEITPETYDYEVERVWILVAIGDTLFQLQQYSNAMEYLRRAYFYDPGNPFINLRLGQCELESVEMSRNVQSGNTQNLKSSAAPVRLPAAPASTPGTSQAAAQAGCVYRP